MGTVSVKHAGEAEEAAFMEALAEYVAGGFDVPVKVIPIQHGDQILVGFAVLRPVAHPAFTKIAMAIVAAPERITVYYRRNDYDAMTN